MDGRDFSLENLSDQTAAGLKLLVFFNLKASDSFFLSLFGFKGQLAAADHLHDTKTTKKASDLRQISEIPDLESQPSSCSLRL